jgi:hypothetical protein
MAQQAQQTFHAILEDGSRLFVTKGEVFPDGHELVKRDDGAGVLFKELDLGEGEEKAAAAKAPARGRAAKGGAQ